MDPGIKVNPQPYICIALLSEEKFAILPLINKFHEILILLSIEGENPSLDISLFNDIINGDMAERFLLSQQLSNNFNKNKNSIYTTLETWLDYMRDVMLIKTNSEELIVNIDKEIILNELGNKFELKTIIESIKVIDKASKNLNRNSNPRITLDNLLIRFP